MCCMSVKTWSHPRCRELPPPTNSLSPAQNSSSESLVERWSDLHIYSGSAIQRGGGTDGRGGLLILQKLLICSLSAGRTLITPIVAPVPLRPPWMSLLPLCFPSKIRRFPPKGEQSETSGWQRCSTPPVWIYRIYVGINLILSDEIFLLKFHFKSLLCNLSSH